MTRRPRVRLDREYRSTTTNNISTMHEVTAVLTLLLSLVSAIGVLQAVA